MWFKIENENVTLCVYAKPNAKNTTILEITKEALHIAIHAPPQDGAANKELILFIARLFNVPKTQITLLRGQGNRYKLLRVPLTNKLQQFINDSPFFIP